jgi:hypothetical protein
MRISPAAADAAKQWTGTFNPRPFDAAGALEIYKAAYWLHELTALTKITTITKITTSVFWGS